jgi:hypothetical protein
VFDDTDAPVVDDDEALLLVTSSSPEAPASPKAPAAPPSPPPVPSAVQRPSYHSVMMPPSLLTAPVDPLPWLVSQWKMNS